MSFFGCSQANPLRLPYSDPMHRHIIRINLTRLHVFQQLLHKFALKARIGEHRDQRVGSSSQNIGRQHERFHFFTYQLFLFFVCLCL